MTQIEHRYPTVAMFIDGNWVSSRPAWCQVHNPSTGAVLADVPAATAADLDRALAAAEKGFEIWRKVPLAERSRILQETARLTRLRKDEIAAVITLEQGKTFADAKGEVERAATFLDWDSQQLFRTYGRIVPTSAPLHQLVVKEPIGPIAAFTPWNVPISALSRKLSGALSAGCSVVVKPAEETPATACLFVQCFLDAGVPPQAINLVFGNPAQISAHLIASPVIRMITLTGSVGVGKQLTRLAAEGMKPVLMELGGHAPVLIDRDVDAVALGRLSAKTKFRMAGQICVSPTRFLVHREVYDTFVGEFAAGAKAIRVGDGFAEGVEMGPLAGPRRVAAMEALVSDALARGARLAAGGKRIGNEGSFYAPTVLTDVPLDAEVMSVEPFGPLAACVAVDSMDQAIRLANALPVGLAAYGFTNSLPLAERIAAEVQAGSVAINVFTSPGPDAPFGGYKESGIGREGGKESLDAYMISKTVTRCPERV